MIKKKMVTNLNALEDNVRTIRTTKTISEEIISQTIRKMISQTETRRKKLEITTIDAIIATTTITAIAIITIVTTITDVSVKTRNHKKSSSATTLMT